MIDANVTAMQVSVELHELMLSRAGDQRPVWGLPYFSAGLNNLTGGAHRGEMSIVAARPGVGKSFFAAQNAVSMAKYLLSVEGKQRYPGGVVKLVLCEMSASNFQMRLACQMAKVSQRRVMRGKLSLEQQQRFDAALRELAVLPIQYMDSPEGFEATKLWLADGGNCAWFCVDHIGIMPAGDPWLDKNPTARVAHLAKGFRQYTRYGGKGEKSGPPGLLLSQLNRDVEKSEDKRPMLSHLRQSGALEEDASGFIGFLYRPDMYVKAMDEDALRPKKSELIVAKQRNGPLGTIEMWWAPTLPGWIDESQIADDIEDDQ